MRRATLRLLVEAGLPRARPAGPQPPQGDRPGHVGGGVVDLIGGGPWSSIRGTAVVERSSMELDPGIAVVELDQATEINMTTTRGQRSADAGPATAESRKIDVANVLQVARPQLGDSAGVVLYRLLEDFLGLCKQLKIGIIEVSTVKESHMRVDVYSV